MGKSVLEQAGEAASLAQEAFASGDPVTEIASPQLAAQLVQLVRLRETMDAAHDRECEQAAMAVVKERARSRKRRP